MTNIPDSHKDLLQKEFAVLATVGPSGRPQQSVVWFVAEDESICFSLSSDRQKLVNLEKDPDCSVVILDPENGYRYLEVRGRAEVTADPEYDFAARVGAKYGGADLRQYDKPGDTRHKVRIVAERVRAVNMGA
jgi:PPOX class probable F420-dependent enzyme